MENIDVEIDKLEICVSADPKNLSKIAALVNKCVSYERKSVARPYVTNGVELSHSTEFDVMGGIVFAESLINVNDKLSLLKENISMPQN